MLVSRCHAREHGAHRLGAVRGHQVDGEHLRRRRTRRGDAGSRELGDAREREGGGGEKVHHLVETETAAETGDFDDVAGRFWAKTADAEKNV